MAEYLRTIIDRDLGEAPVHADASAILALGDSRGSDIARDKDQYLGAAVDAARRRR